MKKWGIIAAAVVVIALVVVVLVGRARARRDPNTVVIWWAQWAPADGLAQLAEEFTEETGVKVTVHQIPWSSYQDEVFRDFGNRQTSFDIVVGDSQWIGRGAEKGFYLDLTDWLAKNVDLKTIHPRAIEFLCEYPAGSGKYFGAPCETDAVAIAYRRDLFEDPAEKVAFQARYNRELTIPKTWDEFTQVAEFFTRPGDKKYGCALLTGRDYDSLTMGFQQFMWAFGGEWGDRKTHQVAGHVNSPESVAGLEFMKKLLGYAPPEAANYNYSKTIDVMKNGSVAMSMSYCAFFPDLTTQMGDKVGYFPVPSQDGKQFSSLGGQGFSISTKTTPELQDKAKQFIAWFCKKGTQEKWVTKPGGFTANTEILASEAFRKAQPYNEAFAVSLDNMKDFWNVPQYNELLSVAQQYVGEALDGVKTPKEALDAVAEGQQKIMVEAGLLKQ